MTHSDMIQIDEASPLKQLKVCQSSDNHMVFFKYMELAGST